MKTLKIYSSKKVALNSIDFDPFAGVTIFPACTGKYKTSIKEMETSKDVSALYKSYRSDRHGKYVKVYAISKNKERIEINEEANIWF